MRRETGVLATSAVDRHGERFSEGALQSMVDQVNSRWVSVGVEHDPRHPPAGRVVAARLVRRSDEVLVEGEFELFEEGDVIPLSQERADFDNDRPRGFGVAFDRSYREPGDRADIDELAKLLRGSAEEEFKKSVEHVSILTVLALFALHEFAGGFLQKFGTDAYDALKAALKRLVSRRKARERLLVFRVAFEKDGVPGVANVILTNPTPNEIESFLSEGVAQLPASLDSDFASELGTRVVTYDYRDRTLQLRFGVRRDGVPLFPKTRR